jgi:hypothetical protein
MFPVGAPGVALLVLRICIAAALSEIAFTAGWQHIVFLILLGFLCIGMLTPVTCGLAAAGVVFDLAHTVAVALLHPLVVVLATVSLAFVGPGAYSVDARLFGRRVVISTTGSDFSDDDPSS